MLGHSAAFAELVFSEFARPISRVDVLEAGVVVLAGIPATASITATRSDFTRRSATLTLPGSYIDDDGVEHVLAADGAVGDLLAPFGNELRVWIGFEHEVTGRQELLCQGTFVIWDHDVDENEDVSITGYDRAKLITDRRFPFARHVAAGTSAKQLAIDLLDVVPWGAVQFRGHVDDVALPALTFAEDRDEAAQTVAEALGCEVFCDVWGAFVYQPIPDPYGDPVLTLTDDDIVVTGTRSLSRDGVKNGIVARSQSSDVTPVMSKLVQDEVKSSPTYVGRFGLQVGFVDNSAITTQAQADRVAEASFRDLIGAIKSEQVTLVPHYALEPGDPVRIGLTGTVNQRLLDEIAMSTKEDDTMSASTRTVQIVGVS